MADRATLTYQPALDGVRAFAVVAVLFFHGGVPGFGGGYLGVSVFFTLSGYLITSLLLAEHDRAGRVDLPAFYGRRLRRLLPASLLCIGVIVVLAAVTDVFDRVASLRADVLGSLLQVANWVFLAGEGSYQDLLARSSGAASPLDHFWSLAIEEQFYWVWPPTMFFVLTRVPRRRGRVVVVGAITAAFLVAAPVIATVWGPDAAYWATPARIGEILVGAFLAVVLAGRTVDARWGRAALPALATLGAAVVLFPSDSGPAYEGALPLVALVSGFLLLGLQAEGPVRDVMSLGPFVWLGRISYGVYVFHWPIYVLVDADRLGTGGVPLLAVRLGITLTISELSYRLLERPVRLGPVGLRPTFATSLAATGTMVVVAAVAVPIGQGDYWLASDDAIDAAAIRIDDADADAPLVGPAPTDPSTEPSPAPSTVPPTSDANSGPTSSMSSTPVTDAGPAPTVAPAPTTLPELGRPIRIVVTGDSTAGAIGTGVVEWAAANPDLAQAEVVSAPGCGFLTGGERQIGDEFEPTDDCDDWAEEFLLPAVERTRPDVVMVMVTAWDILDRRWDGDEVLTPTASEYAERLDVAYSGLVDDLLASGAGSVGLVHHPIPDGWWAPETPPQEEPARHAVLFGVHDSVAAQRIPADVVPLDVWFTENDLDRDESVRPDGIHVDPEAAIMIAEEYLGPSLISIAIGASTS